MVALIRISEAFAKMLSAEEVTVADFDAAFNLHEAFKQSAINPNTDTIDVNIIESIVSTGVNATKSISSLGNCIIESH